MTRRILEMVEQRTLGAGLNPEQERSVLQGVREAGRRAITKKVTGDEYGSYVVPPLTLTTVDGIEVQTLFVISAYRTRGFAVDKAMRRIPIYAEGEAKKPEWMEAHRNLEIFTMFPEAQATVMLDVRFPESYSARDLQKVITENKRVILQAADHEAGHIQRLYSGRIDVGKATPSYVRSKERGHATYLMHPLEMEANIIRMVKVYRGLGPRQRKGLTLKKLMNRAGLTADKRIVYSEPENKRKVMKRLWDHEVKLREEQEVMKK